MGMVMVPLNTLEPGAEIQCDVHDSSGQLILKAPVILDENTKQTLLERGVRKSSFGIGENLIADKESGDDFPEDLMGKQP